MIRPAPSALVDCPEDVPAAERSNHSLNLPPVAKTRHVAVVTAALGANGRFESGVIAKALDQVGGVGQRNAAMDEGTLHAALLSGSAFPDCGRLSSTRR